MSATDRARRLPSGRRRSDGPPSAVPGVPRRVSGALDALDEPDLTAQEVGWALTDYLRVVSRTRADLSGPHNDWTQLVVPDCRGVLERAMDALPTRHAVLLWRVVGRADEQLLSKTLHNPRADPSLPWFARRCWY